MNDKKLSIVIPTYNDENNILVLFEALGDVLQRELPAYAYEIIFVDDGSQDETWERIQEITNKCPHVKGLMLSRNFGQQAALTAGMSHATGQAIITMDSDFQDPPVVIPKMVKKWENGSRIVYGRRKSRFDSLLKRFTADLYYRTLSISSDVDIPRNVGEFRLIDRLVLNHLKLLGEQARYLRGMVPWLGFKHEFVDFERPNRKRDKPEYTIQKLLRLAMDGLLNFSFLPLRVGMWAGACSILAAASFFIYMAVDTLLNGTIYPLYRWIVVILFGFMGAQFAFLWIIGEYIGRIYNDVRRRPLYVLEASINIDRQVAPDGSKDSTDSATI